jgi:hypothetical protein
MTDMEYNMALSVGAVVGKDKCCGNKSKYDSYDSALKYARLHNSDPKADHYVAPYPCCFCKSWHNGKPIPKEEIIRLLSACRTRESKKEKKKVIEIPERHSTESYREAVRRLYYKKVDK